MSIYVKCSSTNVRNCLTDFTVGVRKGGLTSHQMPLGRREGCRSHAAESACCSCGFQRMWLRPRASFEEKGRKWVWVSCRLKSFMVTKATEVRSLFKSANMELVSSQVTDGHQSWGMTLPHWSPLMERNRHSPSEDLWAWGRLRLCGTSQWTFQKK